jgi:hypothetical protein
MAFRYQPINANDIHNPTPVIYDPNLELYLSVVEQRYSFYLNHRAIKGKQRWLHVSDGMPSNIIGHPVGGIDYLIKRIAFSSKIVQGTINFKLFNTDIEVYNFSVTNQISTHIEDINLELSNVVDFGMSINTDYPTNSNDYVDFPAVSVFARRIYEEPPVEY